jgi:hypothetical protein
MRNDTDQQHLSCDIRFQPASEQQTSADMARSAPDMAGERAPQAPDASTMQEAMGCLVR